MSHLQQSKTALQWPTGKLNKTVLIFAIILFIIHCFFLFSHLFLGINPSIPLPSELPYYRYKVIEATIGILATGFLLMVIAVLLQRSDSFVRKMWLKYPFTLRAILLYIFASFGSWCFGLVAILTGGEGIIIRTISLVSSCIAPAILTWGLLHGENLSGKNF